ncbi:hypothetical protein F2Q69_00055362 [Brassica cretica]|uniref:GRF-type domain-containing protein n=1 Tax=Brassica cretica TaxID=69181 RepID=A0A8S9MPU2_BRACR|nr:hypothetical protein F2Q69_00055362 [Brassica cretica]
MGQDYSYSQPSSSDEFDITSLLQAEAELYADEAESSYNMAGPFQYLPQPGADDGILTTCYCGGEPVVATSYTSKDPGRRYFTCDNADDGDCHVWKWWDVAVMEEMSDFQRQLRELKDQSDVNASKLVKLERTAWRSCIFMEELERITTTVSDLESVCIKVDTEDEVGEPEGRSVGVKAAKDSTKRKKSGKEEELSQLQAIMEVKQKLSKQKLLDRLLAKKDPLTEMETSLKLKLMSEML